MLKINKIFPPEAQGMYVCYIEPFIEGFNYPHKELLMWVGGVWGYPSSDQNCSREIYGYIGPLPSPKITDLYKTNKSSHKKFAIGTLEDIKHGAFIDGPFNTIQEATNVYGEQGQCICVVYTDKDPKFIRVWDHLMNEWKRIKP